MSKKRELKEFNLCIGVLALTFAILVGSYGFGCYRIYNTIRGTNVNRIVTNKGDVNIPYYVTTQDYTGKISVSLTAKEGLDYKKDVYTLSYKKTTDSEYKMINSNIKFDRKNAEKLFEIVGEVEYGEKYDIRIEKVSKNSHKSVVDMYVVYD